MQSQPAPELLTTREAAAHFGVDEWKVRRLYEDATLPQPPRFGRMRVITQAALPAIARALQQRGWLEPEETEAAR